MPREYIDEEMCSLAILNSLDWSDNSWFYSVCRRKKEALTEDLWKLGARLYARLSGQRNDFLIFTPVEYRNQEYYKEMCRCNFNCGMKLDTNKGKIMDSIPQEVLTVEFLLGLLQEDINSVARFNEKALETEISYTADGEIVCEKIWQFVVRNAGDTIRNIELNDERVEYFLCYYDEHSRKYRFCFADKYKKLKAIDGNKKLLLKKN